MIILPTSSGAQATLALSEPDPAAALADSVLTPENRFMAAALGGQRNCFLTGMAGTGKSTMLRRFIGESSRRVDITAPTGVAALNVGGSTIHRFCGMMLGPQPGQSNEEYFYILENDHRPSIKAGFRRITRCQCLVIDEVSMLPGRQFEFVEFLFRRLRGVDAPFGGCQIIATGDFLQLPPVRTNEANPYDWAFSSPVWAASEFKTINLEIVRRQDEKNFVRALADFRRGRVTGDSARLLQSRIRSNPPSAMPRLFTHNVQVDRWNNYQLGDLPGDETVIEAVQTGPDTQRAFLTKNLLTPATLRLKPGAFVMFTINKIDPETQRLLHVNGQTGIVEAVSACQVLVATRDHGTICVVPFTWKFDQNAEDGATFTQFPLRLSWAMTIHKCVSGNAMVPTHRGYVPMRNVVAGDEVLTGHGGWKRVLATQAMGEMKTVSVETKMGVRLSCTPDHRVLAVKPGGTGPEWVPAEQLTGMYVCLPLDEVATTEPVALADLPVSRSVGWSVGRRAKALTLPANLDENLAYFMGALVGDGSYAHGDTVCFSNQDKECLDRMRDQLRRMGLKWGERWRGPCAHIWFSSVGLFQLMEDVGMARVVAHQKRIPKKIWQAPVPVRAAFLRGLCDTDGSASNGMMRLVSVSRKLLEECQLMLLGFGIVSYILNEWRDDPAWHHAGTLHVSGSFLASFQKHVGFHIEQKRKRLADAVARHLGKTSLDFIPHGEFIKADVRKAFAGQRSQGKHGRGLRALRDRRMVATFKTKNVSRHHLMMWREALEKQGLTVPESLLRETDHPMFYSRVEWIEPGSAEAVFDLEVEKDHSFVANGMVCHNCQGITLDSAYLDIRAAREPGQAYVAVSRVRTLAGLNFKDWFRGVFVSNEAIEFYKNAV